MRKPKVSPWSVPLVAVVGVAASALLINGIGPQTALAAPHPALAAVTASQLLVDVQSSTTQALSGTVTEIANWGLPSLPGSDTSASLNWQGIATGSHTLKVSVDGPDKQRIAMLGPLSEADVVHNGKDLWTYTSSLNQVSHTDLSKSDSSNFGDQQKSTPSEQVLTPQGAAQRVLNTLDPSTIISVDPTAVIAGRSAYTLVLSPRDTRSTIRKVSIAIDSQHFVPLRLQVYGLAAKPAFETGFTSISFSRPAAATFDFTPPADASTTTDPLGLAAGGLSKRPAGSGAVTEQPRPVMLGKGWTSILYFTGASDKSVETPSGAKAHAEQSITQLLGALTSPIGNGGDRIFKTSTINALITKDGRVFLGAVSPAMLTDAAARNPR